MNTAYVRPRRVLSVFALVMINVIAVDSLRTLAISAEYGFTAVFYYTIAALIFLIPSALVAAELATGWPKTGGVYVWTSTAFGKPIGFLVIWFQWIYNVVWYPTVLAFIVATLAYVIEPQLAHNKVYLVSTVLVLFWAITLINCFGMRISSWVTTLGALFGTLLPMIFIIILGIIWFAQGNSLQIQMNVTTLFPQSYSFHNMVLLLGIMFGLVGMEMSAAHAEEVHNPQRDYPRALLFSTLIIYISLVLASLAIAIVVPHTRLSLVTGLIDAFGIFLHTFHLHWLLPATAILIVIGGISGISAWIIGPTKGLLIASRDGSIPAIFGKVNRYGAPVPVLIMQAILVSILAMVFLLLPTINSSYWLLTAMTAQLALLMYIGMFAAAIKLRVSQPKTPRAYKIPGGNIGVWLVSGIGTLACIFGIVVGFFPPSQLQIIDSQRFELILFAGMIIFCVLPIVIYKLTQYCGNKETSQ